MNVMQIWAQVPEKGTVATLTLVDAWDQDSIDGNEAGWDEALAKAETQYGARNVRIVRTSVKLDKILASFYPVDA